MAFLRGRGGTQSQPLSPQAYKGNVPGVVPPTTFSRARLCPIFYFHRAPVLDVPPPMREKILRFPEDVDSGQGFHSVPWGRAATCTGPARGLFKIRKPLVGAGVSSAVKLLLARVTCVVRPPCKFRNKTSGASVVTLRGHTGICCICLLSLCSCPHGHTPATGAGESGCLGTSQGGGETTASGFNASSHLLLAFHSCFHQGLGKPHIQITEGYTHGVSTTQLRLKELLGVKIHLEIRGAYWLKFILKSYTRSFQQDLMSQVPERRKTGKGCRRG